MACRLDVPNFGVHFRYDTLEEGLSAARSAMRDHYIQRGEVALKIGPGTAMSVLTDEAIEKNAKEDEVSAKSNGIVLQERYAAKEGFILAVQFGQNPLPPLHFETKSELDEVVRCALTQGVLEYVFEANQDYFFLILGPGAVMLSLTVETYEKQRREAVARHHEAVAEQLRRQTRPGQIQPAGRIILPGRR